MLFMSVYTAYKTAGPTWLQRVLFDKIGVITKQ